MKIIAPAAAATYAATVAAPAASITLVSFTFDVIDALGEITQAETVGTVIDGATGEVSFALEIATNTLAAGVTRAIRQIRMALTYSSGLVYNGSVNYILRSEDDLLVIGENSFTTYLEAELIAFENVNLAGWDGANTATRAQALMSARDSLCRLQFSYDPADAQNRITDWPGGMGMHKPSEWTAADLESLPVAFLLALKKAQVFQADYLLGGSPEEMAREKGTFSKTIGESSEMFRPGVAPIKYPVCQRALFALHGFTTLGKWHLGRG